MAKGDKIRRILKDVSRKERLPGEEESLFESGLLDSFALTDLVSALEKEFKVAVPDADLRPRNFESISKISSYLERLGA
ncbi:MAG: acyl carrier protein [Acidobacteria bacterium]|nr:acyl carrier protein [Acidobacteriota bacterium]